MQTVQSKDALRKKVRAFIRANRQYEPVGAIIRTQVVIVKDHSKAQIAAVVEEQDNGDAIVTVGAYYDWLGNMVFYGTPEEHKLVKDHMMSRSFEYIDL